MCHIRRYTPITYNTCLECSSYYTVCARNSSKSTRCRKCRKEYKRAFDRMLIAKNRKNPVINEVLKQRCTDYQYKKRWLKWTGQTSNIDYNFCDHCTGLYLIHERYGKGLQADYCKQCNDNAKPISIEYGNCVKCNRLICGRLVGFFHRKYCSNCAQEIGRQRRIKRSKTEEYKEYKRKRKQKYGNHRRRARTYGVYYEPVSKDKMINRDNNKCQVCGSKCNKVNLDKREATIGHIIPMSRGGAHTYSNVRLECRDCNNKRGVKAKGEQITLFTIDVK